MTKYYPIFLNLTDRLCVVIGGGSVAERKVLSLLESGARVKLISPEITVKLRELKEKGALHWEKRLYQRGDLTGAFLVIAATNDPKVQEAIFQEAEERSIPCNVVDKPDLCSFIVPSTIKRGGFVLAISTGGASPALARRIREILEKEFSPDFELYVSLMGAIRGAILKQPLSPQERENKLQRLALAPLWQYIKNGDWSLIRIILEKEGLKDLLSEISSLGKVSRDTERPD
ncbi:MAG: bifunctional precorrin-2 dehydrogenase/sirohydrochlorin ferrochelatase [Caldimicrobium sp.]|nr:bifunctional precorrin-2 dehydrogenase/sirohydrochlorin ferrochelatase [Caldimicrobium sp.]MCX7612649.1 bifunctional precorrin-2 dehydrogenase/sirohydrochlorin ferrochelatase [Caldimicrobium sp.]MDW8182198.1 bifunctional precorrin-2 dehydrogenase/sirohydrochlorin ferrochelatase [Caldimicrobium sp.]